MSIKFEKIKTWLKQNDENEIESPGYDAYRNHFFKLAKLVTFSDEIRRINLYTNNTAKREIEMSHDYTVEFIWIMSKYQACARENLEELIRTPAIRSLVSGHLPRIAELVTRATANVIQVEGQARGVDDMPSDPDMPPLISITYYRDPGMNNIQNNYIDRPVIEIEKSRK